MPASGVHSSGAAPQQPLRFEAVVAIHVDFRVAQCRALAGDVISAGLPALRTVGGTFHLFVMGTRGAAPGSELVLSELRSVGSLFFRAVAYSTISIPALANLTSGGIHLSDMYQLRHLDMASVEAMAGNFYVDSAPALASLCEFRLPASGSGNPDIIFSGPFLDVFISIVLSRTHRVPCAMPYFVPMLIGCRFVLAFRCC